MLRLDASASGYIWRTSSERFQTSGAVWCLEYLHNSKQLRWRFGTSFLRQCIFTQKSVCTTCTHLWLHHDITERIHTKESEQKKKRDMCLDHSQEFVLIDLGLRTCSQHNGKMFSTSYSLLPFWLWVEYLKETMAINFRGCFLMSQQKKRSTCAHFQSHC